MALEDLNTSTDANAQRILALIAAHQAQQPQPVAPSLPNAPMQMGENPLAPSIAPPAPSLAPGAPTPTLNVPQANLATMGATAVPNIAPAPAPDVVQEKPKPGLAKTLLTNFLFGGGQALTHRAGLPTEYEKQQNAAHLALSQQAANDTSAYRQAQIGGLDSKAAQLDASMVPTVVPPDFPIKALAGKTVTQAAYQALLKAVPSYQGRVEAAQIGGDSREAVADTKATSAEKIAKANTEARAAIAQGNWRVAAQRLALAGGNQNLRQLEYRMRAYGTGADGQPLAGIEFGTDGRSVGTAMQANVRPTVTARNAGERADTMQDLATRIRGALNDPEIRSGIGPILGRVNDARGHAGTLDGPLAELRNDLVSYGAFQAGLHPVRGIGGLQYFDKVMGGLGQSPEELLAKLNSNDATAKSVQQVAKGKPSAAESSAAAKAPPRPAGVPDGAMWNKQGNGGKGSWRMP